MNGPLDGMTVVDQTQALAGPYCSMILGDLGANVIKIERPGVGDQSRSWGPPFLGGESTYYLAVNRNKRSLALNIATPQGQEIMHKLIGGADIFMTNLPRQASLEKYNIDYATMHGLNPRLIYASITGYGHTGPRAGEPGYDLISQAESGTMHLTGSPEGGPMRFPTPMADMTTGLFTLIGILAALHHRHASGEGQFIDISLQEGQMTWLENYAGEYFATGEEPPKRGNAHPQVVPYEPVQGGDGEWFILGVGSDNMWPRFCELADLNHLREDARFYTNSERVRNREALMPYVREAVRSRSAAEWIGVLKANGIPSGPIRTVGEALSDPHILTRNFIVELEHPTLGFLKSLATPINLSDTGLTYRTHPPRLGEQSRAIVAELGYAEETVDQFVNDGVIA